jgi:MFS family permease
VAEGVARVPWLVLLVLCSVLALHNAMRIGPVPLIEELRGHHGADYATVGNLVGAYTLAYGFAQLAAGLLTDRFGSRRLGLLRALAVLGLREPARR